MAAQSDGSPCWMGEYVFFGFGEVDTFPQAGCFVRPNQYVTTWTQYQSYTVYNPSTSGNWDGNPTSINEALDRLAAACVAAGHTP